MAYSKTITDANTYFSATNHVRALDWANYSTNERTGALAQSKRELELFIGRNVEDPASSDHFRDDYAIFEQAMYILDNTVRTVSSQNSAQMIDTPTTELRERDYGLTICPIAQKFLARQRLRISRGD